MKKKNILLVDPFGSNFALALESVYSGYNTYAFFSSNMDKIPKSHLGHFSPSVFNGIFMYNGDYNSLYELKNYNFDAVIPCDQLSLRITDHISDILNLPGNPASSIKSRVNKGIARRTLSEKGIFDVNFCQTDDVDSLISWVNDNGYPVILKPSESAGGSIHVKKCSNEAEVRSQFKIIAGMNGTYERNITGEVLGEEYLDGEEYIVNMIHSDGEPYPVALAGVEKIQRKGNASIYKNVFSLDINSKIAGEIFEYTKKISKALDIRWGINDTEVKITSKGVRLVEMNNRMSGARIPYAIEKCSGFNLYRANIRLFSGEKIIPEIRYMRHYNICFLINDRSGIVKDLKGLTRTKNLKSYDSHEIYAQNSEFFPETTDLTNSWGKVILINSDLTQLKKDTQFVHETMELVIDENLQI